MKSQARWHLIDVHGKQICPSIYIADQSRGFLARHSWLDAVARAEGHLFGFLDSDGNETISCRFAFVLPFAEDRTFVRSNHSGRYSLLDIHGEMIASESYLSTTSFSEGLASVRNVDGSLCFIDREANPVLQLSHGGVGPMRCGRARVTKGKTGFLGRDGRIAIPLSFDDATPFTCNGRSFVKRKGKWQMINVDGHILGEEVFGSRPPRNEFEDGLICVEINGKWGFISEAGECVIAPRFDSYSWFHNGLALVQEEGFAKYLDHSGNCVWSE